MAGPKAVDTAPVAKRPVSSTSSTQPSPDEDVAGSVFLISAAGELLKLPIPSTSPRDPLAMTQATRITAFICLLLVSTTALVTIQFPSAALPGLQLEFPDHTIEPFGAKSLTSAMTLFVSIGFLIAIPVSAAVGRRPVVLVFSVMTTFLNLLAGLSVNFSQLMAVTCFQGISCGGSIAICILLIMDGTFIHERPNAFAIFWSIGAFLVGIMFIPFPFIMDPDRQWRPVYIAWCCPCLTASLLAFLFIPETYFIRPHVALDGRVLVQSSTEKVQIYDSWESAPCTPECPHYHNEAPGPSVWAQRLKVRRARGTEWKSAWATFAQMLLCLCNPLLVWVSLLSAAIQSGVVFINLMLLEYLMQSLPTDERGWISINIALSVGAFSLLAIPATGPLITWATRYSTMRSGGTRHAEAYLPGFLIPVISSALSLAIFGLASSHGWPTAVFYFCLGLSNFSSVCGNAATVLWIIEAFPPWASASLAMQMFTSNMVAFGIGINLLAWVKNDVILQSSLIIMILVLFLGAFAVPISFWGMTVRQYIHGRWSESQKGAIRPH